MKQIEVGDIVKYDTYSGTTRLVKVTRLEKSGKNNKDVFDGILIKKDGRPDSTPLNSSVWGYIFQVTQVLKKSPVKVGSFKGDAAKRWQAISDAFTRKYKVGDIVFSPIYRYCKILKMNKNTVAVMQVDERGNETEISKQIRGGAAVRPLLVEKYLFTV